MCVLAAKDLCRHVKLSTDLQYSTNKSQIRQQNDVAIISKITQIPTIFFTQNGFFFFMPAESTLQQPTLLFDCVIICDTFSLSLKSKVIAHTIEMWIVKNSKMKTLHFLLL